MKIMEGVEKERRWEGIVKGGMEEGRERTRKVVKKGEEKEGEGWMVFRISCSCSNNQPHIIVSQCMFIMSAGLVSVCPS